MSPRYNFDPSQASATIEVLPKATYEFQVGEPKSFIRQNSKDEDSYGIRYPLTVMTEGPHHNKRVYYSTYYQSDGGQGFAKQFLMACLGYAKTPAEEKRFNAEQGGKDWSYDPETGGVGDGYRQVTGQRVVGDLDISKNNRTGDDMQQFVGFRSLEEAYAEQQ